MPPPTMSASTLESRLSSTAILEETFAPPMTAMKGFWGFRTIFSSRKIRSTTRLLTALSSRNKCEDMSVTLYYRILTGGRDAKVNIMDKKFKPLITINMEDPKFESISPEIKTLSLDKMGKNLLVGTIGSEIYELSIEPSNTYDVKGRKLVNGHSSPRKAVPSHFTIIDLNRTVWPRRFRVWRQIHHCRRRRYSPNLESHFSHSSQTNQPEPSQKENWLRRRCHPRLCEGASR